MKISHIELSSHCNLTCEYCPQPSMGRKRGFMSIETFVKVLKVCKDTGSKKVWLHVFGEPLLHPEVIFFVNLAATVIEDVGLSTNAVLLTEKKIEDLKEVGLKRMVVSLHAEVPESIIELCEKNFDTTVYKREKEDNHDWGKTPSIQDFGNKCIFRDWNYFVVLSDGSINTCCIQAEKMLDVTIDDIEGGMEYEFEPIELCKTCTIAPQTI